MYWLIVSLLAFVVEAVTVALVSIWFAVGGLLAYCAYLLDWSNLVQILIFSSVSLLLLLMIKPVIQKRLMSKKEKTNLDSIIGSMATVTSDISNEKEIGEAMFHGQIWTARSLEGNDIPANEAVIIHKIEGVKLIVSQKLKQMEKEEECK